MSARTELIRLMQMHNWNYQKSKSPAEWQKGHKERIRIHEMMIQLSQVDDPEGLEACQRAFAYHINKANYEHK